MLLQTAIMSKRPRPSQTSASRSVKTSRSRRWPAAVALALVLLAAILAWHSRHRHEAPLSTATAPAQDPQEARLEQVIQSHASDPKARRALAEYYQQTGSSFAALWQLAVAREQSASAPALSLLMAEALHS